MKPILITALSFFLAGGNPDPTKLYIAANMDGTFDMIQFTPRKDSILHLVAKKFPGLEYDFFSESNLNDYKALFAKRERVVAYKYTLVGDSIKYMMNNGLLRISNKGKFKGEAIDISATYFVGKDQVKAIHQLFKPY